MLPSNAQTNRQAMAMQSDNLVGLLERALEGERTAETQLFSFLRPTIRRGVLHALTLWRLCRGSNMVAAEPEDHISNTVVVLLENNRQVLRRFDRTNGTGRLEPYVFQIAANTTISSLRTKKGGRAEVATAQETFEEVPDQASSPATIVMARDLLERILAILEVEMTPEGRAVFILHFMDGLDGPSICALTGWSSERFWKWASRMRELCIRIAKKLGGQGGDQ